MRLDSFRVVPALPERLRRLEDLAYNLLWSWDEEIRAVFPRIDRELWERSYQNPVLLLGTVPQRRLEELAGDDGFLSLFDRTVARLDAYLGERTWWQRRYEERPRIAYFSAEFGLTECLPIYSGGLGVLAGHHLKSASDLGVPLVGVGLLYQQGYFRQYLARDGWQQELYPTNDFANLPVRMATGEGGLPLRVEVEIAGERCLAQVWRVEVGRVPLVLLDTNVEENPRHLQDITDQLYGGDGETRIRQEIVLGIGGMRALLAMGLRPDVCHMNEGHSALLALERIAALMRDDGLSFGEAFEVARAGQVFTTHTPVPAGFDVFPLDLFDRHFRGYLERTGISARDLLELGRARPDEAPREFHMAALALRASGRANGVSELHGEVSRRLLAVHVPGLPEAEVPVGHVTNGAHVRSCVSREMAQLFDRYLGPDWWQHPGLAESWEAIDEIPDEELWSTHERRRERLVAYARRRLAAQLEQRGASRREIDHARGVLDGGALTIGFARRFATYKRAGLLFADMERLRRILLDPARPVQVLFAGKAHPRDTEGKEMLREVFRRCQEPDLRRHLVFLEDYDLAMARYLVQGCDVWLNTPRRGMEASGTSGMKVLPNGGLNLSVPDGWWCEAHVPEVGWAIGRGEAYDDPAFQDQVESATLYELLEQEVVPLFYSRGADRLPRPWIARMKRSMRELSPRFSTNRMLWEYADQYYLPSARRAARLAAEGHALARELARWKRRVLQAWGGVAVLEATALAEGTRRVGEAFPVAARVRLGELAPEDVRVELYFGLLDAQRRIARGSAVAMRVKGETEPGVWAFEGEVPCRESGQVGFAVRVLPSHPEAEGPLAAGLIAWR
ncbi:MAG TPA: alpha-glucan family phosphorylase [Thermoanaerobaculia bacterium]|nr:alpha-glucan family phosphorylase [Thermoanaerobaculia bacterium]